MRLSGAHQVSAEVIAMSRQARARDALAVCCAYLRMTSRLRATLAPATFFPHLAATSFMIRDARKADTMRGRIAKYLAVAAVLGLLVAGVVVWQRAFPQGPAAPSADVAHCAVYRGLFEHVGGGEPGVFFKSTTQALSADPRRMKEVIEAADGWRPRKYDDHAAVVRVPKRFDRVVAGSDAARTPWDNWPKRDSVRQTFDLDTSRFFQPVKDTNRVSIGPCFDAGPVRAKFHDGALENLSLREKILAFGAHRVVVVRSVSPVGLSADGRHALVYNEYICNGPCAGATFHLLENRNGKWTVIGQQRIWAWSSAS